MKILAFDTAARACSAALFEDGRILASRLREMERGQAEVLLDVVQEVLAEAGASFAGLDRLATTLGPGSFTGLRVGLAAARGLALAGDLPVVGVTTFEAVAHGVTAVEREGRLLLVALDTKRGDLYVQAFDSTLTPLAEGEVLAPAACARFEGEGPLLIVGDGASLLREVFGQNSRAVRWSEAPGHPEAAVIARLAAAREPSPALRPIYLRPPEARLPDG
ncbi:MAG: tRNA (adenosine(37)-N6)-threonylcarbamoyltransferase complex dimerization subunit type 1 TsaB [Alphaproteobacteria bacterium]|nr:tRNA (adenosine(37)-N6)-threonylcarbamoyltransferase complex dimerization subunit type 1 TsaB [Alphaproteobacteria bacterium]